MCLGQGKHKKDYNKQVGGYRNNDSLKQSQSVSDQQW